MPNLLPDPVSVRLVGGPRPLDGRRWPAPPGDALVLVAVRGTRWCALDDLQEHCTHRVAAEQLAGSWHVAVYAASGRPRRLRPRLYRFDALRLLVARRDDHGRWALQVGAAAVSGSALLPVAGAADGDRGDDTIWSRLEDGVDRSAARFAEVASLLPDGPLAERAVEVRRAVEASVADAARLCEVGVRVAPGWLPGDGGDEAAALVSRVTTLVGTIDAATAELVRLHLALGRDETPAETLAVLTGALAELEDDLAELAPGPEPDHQRGDQLEVRNNLDRH
jgi:hypothetical protein